MIVFWKSVAGGLVAVVLMWFFILYFHLWRLYAIERQRGSTGLMGIAGGWGHLVGKPSTVLLLAAGFGVGCCRTVRWSYH